MTQLFRRKCFIQLLPVCLCLIPTLASAATSWVYPVNVRATYLRTQDDPLATTVILQINLAQHNISPGDALVIESSGVVDRCSTAPPESRCPIQSPPILGAFTAGAYPANGNVLATGKPEYVSSPTLYGDVPTDIPHDFVVLARSSSSFVTVPSGAVTLWLALHDRYYSDNAGTLHARVYKVFESDIDGIPLNVRTTYLRTEQDAAKLIGPPIRLANLSVLPGDYIELKAVGNVNYCEPDFVEFSCVSTSPDLMLAFTATSLPPTSQALATGRVQFTSQPTYFGNFSTDIPNDFNLSGWGENDFWAPTFGQGVIRVRVPDNGLFLWATLNDRIYSDNSGDLGLVIQPVAQAVQSVSVNPEQILGGTLGPAAAIERIVLTAPPGVEGETVSLSARTDWPNFISIPAPTIASVPPGVLVQPGNYSVVVPVLTTQVQFPMVVTISAELGDRKEDKLTVTAPTIPELGGQANARVQAILDQISGNPTTISEYNTAWSAVKWLRDRNDITSQDVYLAAAEHYLYGALLVLESPADRFTAALTATGGVIFHEAVKLFLDVRTTPLPQSPATLLSVYWGEKGVYDALVLRFGTNAVKGR